MKIIEVIKPHLEKNGILRQKKTWLITGGVLLVALLTFAGIGYYEQTRKNTCIDMGCVTVLTPEPNNSAVPSAAPATATPTASTVADFLDGTQVTPGQENLHPLAVMIENHPQARPQSGLGEASLVYEALAEGGITRFMAVFSNPTLPIKVGPVRSARTYFVDFATELSAFYAHVGGASNALDQIKNTGVLDLDQFLVGSAAYHREPRAGIAIEHTMYSSTDLLWKYATESKQWSKTGNYQPWTFQGDLPANQRPTSANPITINFSSSEYAVRWDYDPAQNVYLRTMAGAAHKDANTGRQITAKNIVIEIVNRTPIVESGKDAWAYTLTGTGTAVIFQNGTTITGTWKKEGNSRTRYYDANGKEIAFVAGTTWVEITHPDIPISY